MPMTKAQIEDILLKKGIKPVHVNGISMQHTIMKGESYYVIEKEVYRIGDIVLFVQDDCRIVHRIVRKHKGYYQTKGDNYYISDRMIDKSQIIGMIVCKNNHKKLIAYVSILDELLCSISTKLIPVVKRIKVRLLMWLKQKNITR